MRDRLRQLKMMVDDGNPLAAHEASKVCEVHKIPQPPWLAELYRSMFIDFYWQKVFGKQGRGNSLLGEYERHVKAYLRRRVYYAVRDWQTNPHNYPKLPTRLIEDWCNEDSETEWGPPDVMEARRLTQRGLAGSIAKGRTSTIRQALSEPYPETMTFGEFEAEALLGFRPKGPFFGPKRKTLPRHISKLLKKHPPLEAK